MTRLEHTATMQRLTRDARGIARRFGLRGWTLADCDERKRARCDHRARSSEPGKLAFGLPERAACMGCCWMIAGKPVVSVRLFNRRNGRAREYSTVAETLCHELAHVATLHDLLDPECDAHGDEWQYAYSRIAGWARAEEILETTAHER